MLYIQSLIYIFYRAKEFQFFMQNQNQYSEQTVFKFLIQRYTLNIVSCDLFQKLLKDIPKSLIAQAFKLLILESQKRNLSKDYINLVRKNQKNFKKKITHFKGSCSQRLQQIEQNLKSYRKNANKESFFPCQYCQKSYGNKISLGVHYNKCPGKIHEKTKIIKKELIKQESRQIRSKNLTRRQKKQLDQNTQENPSAQISISKGNFSHIDTGLSQIENISIYEESSSNSLLESMEKI